MSTLLRQLHLVDSGAAFAVMATVVNGVFTVGIIGPHGVGKKFVLCLIRPAGKSLRVAGMTALHFLQEHEISVQRSQMLAHFVYHQSALEKR